MGYGNPDLEEIRTRDLMAELKRREEAFGKGLCPYCGNDLVTHKCKFAGTMFETYNYVSKEQS